MNFIEILDIEMDKSNFRRKIGNEIAETLAERQQDVSHRAAKSNPLTKNL